MNLLLLSLGKGALPEFLSAHAFAGERAVRLGYVPDAGRPYPGSPWPESERQELRDLGCQVVDIPLYGTPLDQTSAALDEVDALYLAGGNTFSLLESLQVSGADRVIVDRVLAGLPYIGLSAGSVVAGPDAEPVALLDDLREAPELKGTRGLGLVDVTVIPHADGRIPEFPAEVFERTVSTYAERFPLQLLHDDQALLVTDQGTEIISSPMTS